MNRSSRPHIHATVFAAAWLLVASCGDGSSSDPVDAGGATDTGVVDLGPPRDTGPRPDAATGDPCAADEESAADTVGCNGAPLGASVPANAFAGSCTPDDADEQGSCSTAGDVCDAVDSTGLCVRPCVPGDTYVSTGGCPAGSRCFDFGPDGGGLCYPDCTADTDCVTGVCDADGTCVAPIIDMCAADEDAASTVGCNGPVRGPAAANTLGGRCTPDADPDANPAGSCTDADASCDFEEATIGGICLVPCEPITGTYVSTAECPEGTRCFDFGEGEAYCYADCAAATDCATATCDEDGSCTIPTMAP